MSLPVGSDRFAWADVPLSMIVTKIETARAASPVGDASIYMDDTYMRIFPAVTTEPDMQRFKGCSRNELVRLVLAAMLLYAEP